MYEKLHQQLRELGLDESTPPNPTQWKQLLTGIRAGDAVPNGRNGFADAAVQAELKHLKAAVREATLLNKVIAAVTSTSDTNDILQIICSQLAQSMTLPQAACAVLSADQSHLEVIAEYRADDSPTAVGTIIPVKNNPATQYVMRTHKPLAVVDVQNDKRVATREVSRQRGTVSMLLLPLLIGERIIGTIGVNASERREFAESEIALAANVAAAASQALEKAELYRTVQQELAERKRAEQAMRRQNAYLEVLHETALGLIERMDTDQLLRAIVSRAAALAETEHGYIYVADETHSDIRMRAGLGVFQAHVGSGLQAGEGLSGAVWQQGKMIKVDDYQEWFGQPSKFGRVYGAVSFPLRSGPIVIGVIGLVYIDQRTFGEEELGILARFAQLASLALDNSMLYSALQNELVERERTEAELQVAKETAEAASRIKSNFLASMSHELRTPLNAIIGYSELLGEDIAELENDEMLTDIKRIRSASHLLLEMINEILDISRIEAGSTELHPEGFAVSELILLVKSVVQPIFDRGSNDLHIEAVQPLGSMYTDMVKVRQAIFNLLSNANKFTADGQVTWRIQRTQKSETEYVEFAVTDTGIGISKIEQKRIFEPFTQVDDTISRRYGGTGLGLAISRHYCEMMGGTLSVESELGRGSTFTICLPAEVPS